MRFAQTKLHTSIQGSGNTPAFPAQWLYVYFVLFPESGSFASVACASYRKLNASTAAPEPHDFAVRFGAYVYRALSVYRIHRTFVTMANAPHPP